MMPLDLKTTNNSAKPETLKPFWLLSALACERTFIKRYSIESRCITGPENILCRRARASFSPEILQAAAVKGLKPRRCQTLVRMWKCRKETFVFFLNISLMQTSQLMQQNKTKTKTKRKTNKQTYIQTNKQTNKQQHQQQQQQQQPVAYSKRLTVSHRISD